MIKPSFASVASLFPISSWSRSYGARTAVGDLIAGVTVALTLVPQAIAYAALAGLEPQYGLYASMAGGIVYAVLGTCPQINIGPSALLSLLTFTYTNGTNTDFPVLLCFVSSIVQIVAGAARLGFLVDFVSLPVVSGFTSAAAVTIASSQIKGLLGLRFRAETFVSTWAGVVQHAGQISLPDTLLSIVCCIVLTGMKKIKDMKIKLPNHQKKRQSIIVCNRAFWFIGVSRNAVVVALATTVAYFVYENSEDPFLLTGKITPGLPIPSPPPFYTEVGNTTYTGWQMMSHLGSGILVIPIVGIISNVAIAKAFARGKTLAATQEIVALGLCNLIGSFFRSFPVNGSFSRSAVSDASGVKTPAAGFYTGFIVIITLIVLTPYFYFIPRAALASVVVCAVLNMIDIQIICNLWHTNRLDLIPLFGTFACCLALGIEIGLICGVVIDAALLMYYQSRPALNLTFVDDEVLPPHYAITPVGGLHFAGAETVKSKLMALKKGKDNALRIVNIVNDNGVLNVTNGQPIDANGQPIRVEANGQHIVPNGESNSFQSRRNEASKSSSILVIYCKHLNTMDYTFLQSTKSLVCEWSQYGFVVWCDVQDKVKLQLDHVLKNLLYCDSETLKSFLISLSTTSEVQINVSDTYL